MKASVPADMGDFTPKAEQLSGYLHFLEQFCFTE